MVRISPDCLPVVLSHMNQSLINCIPDTTEGTVTVAKGKRIAFVLVAITAGLLLPLYTLEVVLRFLPVTTSMEKMIVDVGHPIIQYPLNTEFVYSKGWNFAILKFWQIQ